MLQTYKRRSCTFPVSVSSYNNKITIYQINVTYNIVLVKRLVIAIVFVFTWNATLIIYIQLTNTRYTLFYIINLFCYICNLSEQD